MPITYWRKACLSRLIRKLIRAVLRRVRESNLPILSDFRSWMNCTVVCTIFFNNFYHFYFFILCFYGCYFFSVYIFFMLIIILFWVWKIVLSTLFDYLPNALTLFLYITNLQRICCAILIVGLKKRVKKIKKNFF